MANVFGNNLLSLQQTLDADDVGVNDMEGMLNSVVTLGIPSPSSLLFFSTNGVDRNISKPLTTVQATAVWDTFSWSDWVTISSDFDGWLYVFLNNNSASPNITGKTNLFGSFKSYIDGEAPNQGAAATRFNSFEFALEGIQTSSIDYSVSTVSDYIKAGPTVNGSIRVGMKAVSTDPFWQFDTGVTFNIQTSGGTLVSIVFSPDFNDPNAPVVTNTTTISSVVYDPDFGNVIASYSRAVNSTAVKVRIVTLNQLDGFVNVFPNPFGFYSVTTLTNTLSLNNVSSFWKVRFDYYDASDVLIKSVVWERDSGYNWSPGV